MNAELGQVAYFGDRVKPYDCPTYLTALLRGLADELSRVMRNLSQEEYENPFDNSGNVDGFKNDIFEVHAFDWDEANPQPFNFKCDDFELSWYKHLGRGMTMNRELSSAEAVEIFDRCLESIRELDL